MCVERVLYYSFCFFKQKTAYEMRISDWSSDVCSSDLVGAQPFAIDKCQIPLPQASDRAACQPFAVAQVFEQIAAAGQDAPSAFGFRKSPEMVIIAVSGQGLDDPEHLSCVFLVAEQDLHRREGFHRSDSALQF